MNHSQLQELLGSGLKSVVMHETGHILGLRHNFKGSLGISLECLQDKACTGEHGLSASVMDYVPPNIPDAEAPDKVHAYSPVVGGYDKLAIAFGYLPLEELELTARPAFALVVCVICAVRGRCGRAGLT
ncbi:unnamed protein product [Effrenium voratum]|nr:unnamed protein product [Effrenium voratum]